MTTSNQLDRRVSIQQQSTTQDAAGQPIETWSSVAETWASVKFPSGLGAIKADAVTSTVKASVRIRHRSSLPDEGLRVLISGVAYRVVAILLAGRQEWLDLVCERAA